MALLAIVTLLVLLIGKRFLLHRAFHVGSTSLRFGLLTLVEAAPPEPRLVIDDLELFASENSVTVSLPVSRPGLEVNEETVNRLALKVALAVTHHRSLVDTVNLTNLQLIHDPLDASLGDVGKGKRNHNRRRSHVVVVYLILSIPVEKFSIFF